MDTSTILYLIAYSVVCLLVAIEGSLRGHGFLYTLIITILTTPIIGAIMFSHYKPKE